MALLQSRNDILPFMADYHLPYVVPIAVYWILGVSFHYIDKTNILDRYKLHTPAEPQKMNRASKLDVIKAALLQQSMQVALGYLLADTNVPAYNDDYHVEILAQRLSNIFPLYGASETPLALQRWFYPTARFLYWVLIPGFQILVAMMLFDTLQYFTHRAFHVNKWLYKNIHSVHHDIYVPFAYGSYYNHPLETIPIDVIGLPLCFYLAGLNNRQAALFGAIWTFKQVVDHCGYNFPWNPSNIICGDSVLFHDLHHQVWGMKNNFSVYTSFWDRLLGTYWDGKDSNAKDRYLRGKEKAEVSAKHGHVD